MGREIYVNLASIREICWSNRTGTKWNWRPKAAVFMGWTLNQPQFKANCAAVPAAIMSQSHMLHVLPAIFSVIIITSTGSHIVQVGKKKRSYNFLGYQRCLVKQSFSIMPRRKKDLTSSRSKRQQQRQVYNLQRTWRKRKKKKHN